jgi:cytochrome d ubiquinol oxidase subunit I
VDKFLHTIFSGFLLASVFVMGVSAWFLLKKREEWMAKRSILIASIFGLFSSLMVALTGDSSAKTLAVVQPVKFAAFEAHYTGGRNAGLTVIGLLKDSDRNIGEKKEKDFVFSIKIPNMLSIMTGGDKDVYVPGIRELVTGGNNEQNILSVEKKMENGRIALQVLNDYKNAKKANNKEQIESVRNIFRDKSFIDNYFRYFGYAFLRSPEDAIPNVPIAFYSFHLMVMLGFFFIAVCAISIFLLLRGTLQKSRWFLWIVLLSIPLAYIASESGWILAEMGRQPWIIQDLMPVSQAVSHLSVGSVMTTFILFAVLFTALLIAEVSIMIRQIKIGPKHQEE